VQGTYAVTITSTPGTGASHSQTLSLTIGPVTNTFEIANPVAFSSSIAKAGQILTGASVSVRSPGTYTGTVAMTCAIAPSSAGGTCSVSPTNVVLTAGSSTTVNLSVNTFGASAGNDTVTVKASDATTSATSVPFAYSVTDYSVTAGAATPILPGGTTTVNLSLAGQNGYTGTVAASCNVGSAPVTCSLLPVGPYAVSGTAAVPVTATISGPGSTATTAGGNYTVTITTSDAGFATLAHNAPIAVTVQDYKLTTTDTPGGAAKTSANVTAGLSATFTVNVVAQPGGFSGSVVLDAAAVCGGLPSKTTCTLNGLSSGTVTLAAGGTATLVIQTTAATTAGLRPLNRPGAPMLAFWTMLPGVIGAVFVAARRRKRTLWALLALMFLLLILMTACGGGGGGATTAPPPTPIPGTPAGTSTITLTSTSSSGVTAMTRTAQITLTVQ
jgi:hypothetical protein